MKRASLFALAVTCAFSSLSCGNHAPEKVVATPLGVMQAGAQTNEDTAPKQDLRMMQPEVYMRTYLMLFGGLSPLDAQKAARGKQGAALFDTWDDYVSALGFPDYRLDIPRQTQTNALMVATFERLGVALCDRAVEHDIVGPARLLPQQRVIFAFDVPPKGMLDEKTFTPRFDVLHRTFLGYPAALAPKERLARFYELYRETVMDHAKSDPKSAFTPEQAGWAVVCYGLIRHPEFHLY
jgi:hypothetical protein